MAPSDVYGSERGQTDAPARPRFDANELDVGFGRSTSMRAPPSRSLGAATSGKGPVEGSRSEALLHRGSKWFGESIPMMIYSMFYKLTVPPEPLRLQVSSDPEVREKALVQGVVITSFFTEIQQRNSHYLRLLLALIFVTFYFMVVYWQVRLCARAPWLCALSSRHRRQTPPLRSCTLLLTRRRGQADVESKFAVASSVSQSFLVTLPLKIEDIGVFLRLAINSVWTDVNCGNGFCDAPYEFPQFGDVRGPASRSESKGTVSRSPSVSLRRRPATPSAH